MAPPAPGLFSTTTDWPKAVCRGSESTRATVSGNPPGEYGTSSLIGRDGQDWAGAGAVAATVKQAAASLSQAAPFIGRHLNAVGLVVGRGEQRLARHHTRRPPL